jgi:hypothetical protein
MIKYSIRYGLRINFDPVVHRKIVFKVPIKNRLQKHEISSLNKSIKVECLMMPAYVLKMYIKMTFENMMPAKTVILCLL